MEPPRGLYCKNNKENDDTYIINNVDDANKSSNTPCSYINDQLDTSLINTIDDNNSSYTRHSYLKYQLARKIQHTIGRTSTRYYKRYVANNYMVDLPISFNNVNAAEDIFGRD